MTVKKVLNKWFVILCFGVFNSGCHKSIVLTNVSNNFGTLYGYGAEHQISEVFSTADNGYIICGTKMAGEHGMDDGFAMKIDKNFTTVWYKNYGGRYEDRLTSAAMDDEGNILLSGFSYSFGTSVDTAYNHQNSLYYLVYINKNGNVKWEKSLQANPSVKNVDNTSRKVLYLNNNSFVITGETINFSFNYDAFAYCVDKQANLLWSRRFNNVPVPPTSESEEFCQYSCLSEDGNIIMQLRTLNYNKQTSSIKLIKTKSTGSGYASNFYIWKGNDLSDLITIGHAVYKIIPMASCDGDRVAIADYVNKGLAFTKDDGSILKRILFKYPFNISTIYRRENNLVITGESETPQGIIPTCVQTDLTGNILEEVYLNFGSLINPQIELFKVIFSSENEIIAFGTMGVENGSRMLMVRFNHNGQIIK